MCLYLDLLAKELLRQRRILLRDRLPRIDLLVQHTVNELDARPVRRDGLLRHPLDAHRLFAIARLVVVKLFAEPIRRADARALALETAQFVAEREREARLGRALAQVALEGRPAARRKVDAVGLDVDDVVGLVGQQVDVLEEQDFRVGVHAHARAHPHVDVRQPSMLMGGARVRRGLAVLLGVLLFVIAIRRGRAVVHLDDAQPIEQRPLLPRMLLPVRKGHLVVARTILDQLARQRIEEQLARLAHRHVVLAAPRVLERVLPRLFAHERRDIAAKQFLALETLLAHEPLDDLERAQAALVGEVREHLAVDVDALVAGRGVAPAVLPVERLAVLALVCDRSKASAPSIVFVIVGGEAQPAHLVKTVHPRLVLFHPRRLARRHEHVHERGRVLRDDVDADHRLVVPSGLVDVADAAALALGDEGVASTHRRVPLGVRPARLFAVAVEEGLKVLEGGRAARERREQFLGVAANRARADDAALGEQPVPAHLQR